MRLRMHPCAWKRPLLPVIIRHVCNRASANCKFMFYGLLHQSNITFSQQRCERALVPPLLLSYYPPLLPPQIQSVCPAALLPVPCYPVVRLRVRRLELEVSLLV